MKTMIVVLTLLFSTQAFASESFHHSVSEAHQAYLKGDGDTLLSRTKEALIQHKNHPLVVSNLMSLYGAAQRNGVFAKRSVDWNLPKEVEFLNVGVQRRYFLDRGRVVFFMTATGVLKQGQAIEQLQIIRYPDQVVLDKAGKVGEWAEETWQGQPSFWASGSRSPLPVEEGLYLINVQVRNQPMVQGWFLLGEANSSASPAVMSPKVNQAYSTGRPTFHWHEFHSPQAKPDEYVKLSFKVTREGENSDVELADVELDPKATSFKFGDKSQAKEYEGLLSLNPGQYHFAIGYQERTRFGDLTISRVSSTKIPFLIKE